MTPGRHVNPRSLVSRPWRHWRAEMLSGAISEPPVASPAQSAQKASFTCTTYALAALESGGALEGCSGGERIWKSENALADSQRGPAMGELLRPSPARTVIS